MARQLSSIRNYKKDSDGDGGGGGGGGAASGSILNPYPGSFEEILQGIAHSPVFQAVDIFRGIEGVFKGMSFMGLSIIGIMELGNLRPFVNVPTGIFKSSAQGQGGPGH
jgi:hypothetical protein